MDSHKAKLSLIFFFLASLACFCVSIPGEYSIIGHDLDKFPSEGRVLELFQQWKRQHGRFYRHPEEAALRLENFKRNLKYIVEKNAMRKSPNGHRLGLNKFADMSNEEFKRIYMSKVKKPVLQNYNVRANDSCADAPSSLDWRRKGVVTAVKNQGDCGKLP